MRQMVAAVGRCSAVRVLWKQRPWGRMQLFSVACGGTRHVGSAVERGQRHLRPLVV